MVQRNYMFAKRYTTRVQSNSIQVNPETYSLYSLTTKTESKLQAAEMRVFRLIKGVTRRDRIRNVDVREELQVRPLLEETQRNKLRWFGHVKRMDTEKGHRESF